MGRGSEGEDNILFLDLGARCTGIYFVIAL